MSMIMEVSGFDCAGAAERPEKVRRECGRVRASAGERGRERADPGGAGAAGHRTGLGEFLSMSTALFIERRRLRKTHLSSPVGARRHF